MASPRARIRLLALVDFAILLAVVLPGLLDHPYPRPFSPYIQYAGLTLYVVVALYQLALSAALEPKASDNAPSRKT
jgi:hypothetical protein